MNTLRIAGGVMVLAGSLLFAMERRAKMRERIKTLETLARFIRYARRQIDCYSTTVPDILASFRDELFEKYSFADDPKSAASKMPLSREEREELLRFLASLGSGFAEDEIRLCDSCAAYFDSAAKDAREELPRRSRTEIALAFLIGATTLILLI